MQSTSLKKSATDSTSNTERTMSRDEYSRWLCLLEGIEYVSKRVEQLEIRNNITDIDWIKPLAFQKYIDERFESMKFELNEMDQQELKSNITVLPCITSPEPAFA